jgi:adenine phosphoribosyltransferase
VTSYRDLIDQNTSGNRCDVTPLFADHDAFVALVEDLARPFNNPAPDLVAGIDALGFILGAALALRLDKGFVPLRKGGKLPVAVDIADFVDYTGQQKRLELRQDAIRIGERVLLVDEWIETGAQVSAAIDLIERHGGVVLGIATINMDDNPRTRALRERYTCHAALTL